MIPHSRLPVLQSSHSLLQHLWPLQASRHQSPGLHHFLNVTQTLVEAVSRRRALHHRRWLVLLHLSLESSDLLLDHPLLGSKVLLLLAVDLGAWRLWRQGWRTSGTGLHDVLHLLLGHSVAAGT